MRKFTKILMLMLCLFVLSGSVVINTYAADTKSTDESEQKTEWKTKRGKKYYYINGVKQTGFVKIDKKTYYFDKKGVMQTGWETINKKKYYFDKKGGMQTGFTKIKKKTYYFDKKGVMQTGWEKVNKKTYYFDKKGVMQTGWETISKKKYYFDSKGVMQTGFKTIKSKKYYFDKKGVMQTGFTKVSGKTYYFDKKGVMQTGWETVSRKKYYFDSKGRMQTGFKTIKSKKYYFDKKGVMQTGFTKVSGKTYYFDSKGVMQTGLKTISRKTYYFDKKGVMQTGWVKLSGKQYYFNSKGVQLKNTTVKIGSLYCVFDKKGVFDEAASYGIEKGVKVHSQYYTDPQVSDEKLLAAIIYSEAGNQKQYPVTGKINNSNITVYKGQLAVGYVIANRMRNGLGFKEVIYKTYQFEPARTGVLTRYLENYNLVSQDCKNAAKIIINDVKRNTNSVPTFRRSNFRWQNFWALSYARTTNFFNVYDENEYEIMQGHVFFNYTKTIN